MNTETRAPARAARKEGALTRWIVTVFVVGLLLLGSYKGALWLQAHRDSVLPALRQPSLTQATNTPPPAPAASGLVSAPPARPKASQPGNEPPAPAVLGAAPPPAEPGSAVEADDATTARDAQCGYLAAETARLGHEFDQPLPPTVLDQIASRLKALRARSARLKCAGEPAAPAASAPTPARARPQQQPA